MYSRAPLDDLGWAEDEPGQSFRLTLALAALAEALAHLHRDSAGALRAYAERDRTDDEIAARDALACATYGQLLARLAQLGVELRAAPDSGRGPVPCAATQIRRNVSDLANVVPGTSCSPPGSAGRAGLDERRSRSHGYRRHLRVRKPVLSFREDDRTSEGFISRAALPAAQARPGARSAHSLRRERKPSSF